MNDCRTNNDHTVHLVALLIYLLTKAGSVMLPAFVFIVCSPHTCPQQFFPSRQFFVSSVPVLGILDGIPQFGKAGAEEIALRPILFLTRRKALFRNRFHVGGNFFPARRVFDRGTPSRAFRKAPTGNTSFVSAPPRRPPVPPSPAKFPPPFSPRRSAERRLFRPFPPDISLFP